MVMENNTNQIEIEEKYPFQMLVSGSVATFLEKILPKYQFIYLFLMQFSLKKNFLKHHHIKHVFIY